MDINGLSNDLGLLSYSLTFLLVVATPALSLLKAAMVDPRTNAPNVDGSQGSQLTRCGSSQHRRRSSYQRNERGRRSWSDREEAVLISALKELVALGWKSDNGFRGGYLNKIEECAN
ncbi:hypothetical protein SASPL_107828 [Salvia splendens]|uniref:Uncharacterized protein n=1 Tax=Salvia splendens TaxID=180675 RepID=A0A8X8YD52_SALSN|nr:hypothetical protein SASPL_107828 [Salvia splendens]